MQRHPLAGVTAPLVTTLNGTGHADPDGALSLLAALAANGVDSLLLLGSNGEGPLLPPEWTREYVVGVTQAWRELRPGGTVAVNVSGPGTVEMLRRAEIALSAAPDVLVTTPPSYFHHRPAEIEQHLRALQEFAHPWAIYNAPKYACPLPAEVFQSLLDAAHLVGMKDSSDDLDALTAFVAVAAQRVDVAVSQGAERSMLAGLQAGADGIVPGLANISPAVVVALFDRFRAGDLAAAGEAQGEATALTGIHAIRPGVPTIKAILRDRGLLTNAVCAPPLAELTPAESAALRTFLVPHERWLLAASAEGNS